MRYFAGFAFVLIFIVLSVKQMRSKTHSARFDFIVAATFALIALVGGSMD
jgi:hypothetical protein